MHEEIYHDFDYSEIFDTTGHWKKQHIRRLIHVMDNFRISHDAYHELKIVSKGHLPPPPPPPYRDWQRKKKLCQN